jgi:uncharacterized membrane protein HdeD (DUF308 family)
MIALYYVFGILFLLDSFIILFNLKWASNLVSQLAPRLSARKWMVIIGCIELLLGNYFIYLATLN